MSSSKGCNFEVLVGEEDEPESREAEKDEEEERGEEMSDADGDEYGSERDEEVEFRVPKRMGRVQGPTQRMRAEHEASGHAQYRPWCSACVCGRGRSRQHRAGDPEEDGGVPAVGIDYGFLGPRWKLVEVFL